ncbi:hypothetical protein IGI04_025837 [Brassica rapa subsp. trilocularis]|uniref:Uncharacterized protein n=1 Tax=Brassica rapa subsp. trilocularis TaxID=1813537 RepID=A0ABQ7KX04_BRACM|nr:hypothetical protein IGI04_025837 [Brassica rapa subsp. trilocularis]
MNRSNSMSRSLHIFFLDLVTGEIRNSSIIFFFSFLFLLVDLLSWFFDGSTYPFICRSGLWKTISFRSDSTLFFILRSKAKVRLILVGFCQRRHGILKTHCFGLVAEDKCHDIADHFSYAGSGCHIHAPGFSNTLGVHRYCSDISLSHILKMNQYGFRIQLHIFISELVTPESSSTECWNHS